MKTTWAIVIIVVIVLLGVFFLSGDNNEVAEENEEEKTEETTKVLSVETAEVSLVGTWVSLDDDKFVLEIKEDRTSLESYDSASVDEGTYVLSSSIEGDFGDLGGEGVFMVRTSGEEVYSYRILSLNETTLEMVYLEGAGGILRFERMSDGDSMMMEGEDEETRESN